MSAFPQKTIPRRSPLGGGPYPPALEPGELYVTLSEFGGSLLIGGPEGQAATVAMAGGTLQNAGATDGILNACGTILFDNPAPTTIVTFSEARPFMRFTVQSRNGNTTIQHNARIRLKAAADIVLNADTVLMFQGDETGFVVKQI